ncbi:hypothetical protein [Nocardioides sp. NPDC047086]|uniref:hypothetical protein n=1 Tax=Nocardioides sp. NPDC047086 TaxID=3154810 RepID=UPI0033F9DF13
MRSGDQKKALGCLLSVLGGALLTGCSSEPEDPGFINQSEVSGSLTPVGGFEPEAGPPCDLESATVLRDRKATDFKAWTRVVDGHEEEVVVGIWRVEEASADDAFDEFQTQMGSCETSSAGRAARITPIATDGDRSVGFTAESSDPEGYSIARAYAWAQAHEGTDDGLRGRPLDYGYMATVWLERADGSSVSSDLKEIMSAQLREIPGY